MEVTNPALKSLSYYTRREFPCMRVPERRMSLKQVLVHLVEHHTSHVSENHYFILSMSTIVTLVKAFAPKNDNIMWLCDMGDIMRACKERRCKLFERSLFIVSTNA